MAKEPVDVGKFEQQALEKRHLATREKMLWFSWAHLPSGLAQDVSMQFGSLAWKLLSMLDDGPQLTIALQRLIEAKDAAVRQALAQTVYVQPNPATAGNTVVEQR
jgi:hypothetical protein